MNKIFTSVLNKQILILVAVLTLQLAAFNCSAQTWLWAKSAVGTMNQEGNGVTADVSGNVFVTGYFVSPTITFGTTTLANIGVSNIFIAKYDLSGNALWAKRGGGGGPGADYGYSITTDVSGNAFITGLFGSTTITFGTTTLTNIGGNDIFITKYDASGNALWAKSAGAASGLSVSADAGGNVFVTGNFNSPTITFGTTTLTNIGSNDIFIAKYDASGNVLWAKSAGGTLSDVGYSVSADPSGNVFVTGCFGSPTITFGTTILTNISAGNQDIFIAKYDPNGNVLWAKSAGGTLSDVGYSVSADPSGNVFVTGYFQSPTITFGTIPLTASTFDVFIAKYDSNGNVLWARNSAGTTKAFGYSISADICGNVYVTGSFYTPGNITFGSITLTPPAGSVDPIFIVKYDASGNALCASALASGGDDQNAVSTDALGDVYIGGDFQANPFSVGSTTLTRTGSENVFVAKWQPCSSPLTVTTNQTNAPCGGACAGTATVTPAGGTSPYTYLWNPSSQTTSAATGLCAGTYTVTVNDASCSGNSTTATVTITASSAITASVSVSPASCSASTGSATVTPSGGTPAYTYLWSPSGGTNASATGLSAGSYTCTISDAGGCTKTSVANISTLTSPTVTVVSSASVSCNGGSSGSAAITVSGGTAPYTYLWCNAQTSSAVSGLSAGVCNVTVTDNAGCVGITAVSITQPPALTTSATATNLLCSASSAGTATVTPSGGTPAYTYLWNPTSQTTSAATNLSAGNYTCTISDANGCTASQSVSITAPTAITASVTTNNAPCLTASGSATVTPSGGTPAYTYFWNPGGQTTQAATGLSAGSYTVTVTDAGGCSETAAANISNTGSPWGYISSIGNVACNGLGSGMATVTVTIGTAPFTYLWDNGQTTASATGLSAGSHQVTITDGLGCIVIVDTTLTQPAAITTSVTSAIAACGKPDGTAGVTPSGGTPGYIYLWSPSGGTNATATGLSGGTYSVTITDANGCTAVSTVSVSSSPSVTAAAGPNATICGGQMVTLNASGGTSYLWSNGITTSSVFVSPSATTTYSVIVSAGACSDTAYAAITVNPSPIVSVSGSTLLCRGDIATLTASGGTTYLWSNGSTTSVINVSPTATTTYTVVSSNGFCPGTNTVTVSVSPPPVASASNATICAGENATLDAAGGGNYLWNNGATSSSIQINPTTNTSYSVIVSIGTCSDTANATVTVNALPTPVAWSNVTITAGMSATLSASGGASYSWIGGASGSSVTVSPAITTIYCVWVSNNDCRDSACVTVTVEPMDCSEAATGKLYLPDAFSPNNDGENDFLRIYFGNMLCIKSFELHLYNRWGEQVFETNDPDFRWDGSYKSKPQNTAVFVYYMNATLITGEKITKKGNVGLLR